MDILSARGDGESDDKHEKFLFVLCSFSWEAVLLAGSPPLIDVLTAMASPLNDASGGLVFRWELNQDSSSFNYRSDNRYLAEFILYRQTSQKFYRIKQYLSDNQQEIGRIWSLPAGKYVLVKIVVNDSRQKPLVWTPKQGAGLLLEVPGKAGIAALGRLILVPLTEFTLDLRQVRDSKQKEKAALLISASSGSDSASTSNFQPKKGFRSSVNVEEVGGQYEPKVIATYRVRPKPSQTQMTLGLGVVSPKDAGATVKKNLEGNLAKFKSCYQSALVENDQLAGDLSLSLVYKAKTRRIVTVQARSGSLRDPGMVDCLSAELSRIDLGTGKDTLGVVNFAFKTDG